MSRAEDMCRYKPIRFGQVEKGYEGVPPMCEQCRAAERRTMIQNALQVMEAVPSASVSTRSRNTRRQS